MNTLAAFVVAAAITGPPGDQAGVSLAPHPSDAIPVVAADVAAAGPAAAYYRYVWIPTDRTKAAAQIGAVQVAINAALNHSQQERAAVVLGNGVLRIDLFSLAGSRDDVFEQMRKTWDRFGGTVVGLEDQDPYFLTNFQQLGLAARAVRVTLDAGIVAEFFPEAIDPLDAPDDINPVKFRLPKSRQVRLHKPWGTLDDRCLIELTDPTAGVLLAVIPKTAVVIIEVAQEQRAPAPYLGLEIVEIMEATGSRAPIVHAHEFIRRALTQVDRTGLYYDFRGIGPSTIKGVTDFDFILSRITGVTMDEVAKRRGRQTAVLLNSKVTEGQRLIWGWQASQVQPGISQAMVIATGDFAKDTPDNLGPWSTLDEARPAAIEMFIQHPSGQILTLLFLGYDQKTGEFVGSIQDSAPDNVASDHAAPGAGDRRINGWFSCHRCHVVHNDQPGPFILFKSDIGEMIRLGKTNFTTAAGLDDPEALDQLVGELSVAWEMPLQRANQDYNHSLELLTGDVILGADDTPAQRLIGELVAMYADAVHDPVDARRALLHAGLDVPDEAAAAQVVAEMFAAVPGQVRYVDALGDGRSISTQAWRAIAVDFIGGATAARRALAEQKDAENEIQQ